MCVSLSQTAIKFTPQWIHPMLGEFLFLAQPGHHQPCWLVSGCPNPHFWWHEPTLVQPKPLHHHLLLTWHHRSFGDHGCDCLWPKPVKDWGLCPPKDECQLMQHIMCTSSSKVIKWHYLPFLLNTYVPWAFLQPWVPLLVVQLPLPSYGADVEL